MKNSILKTVLTLLTFSVILSTVLAQAPESFSYQAIVRDNSGQPLSNTSVTFQFNIYQGSASGTLVYSENHSVTTNDFGLVNLQIGQGNAKSGNFATIDWGNDAYFLNVRIDQGSGFVDMGTQQFISVPYAMYAKNAGTSGTVGAAGNNGDVQLNSNDTMGATPDLHWDFTKNKFTVGQSADDGRMIIQQDANAPDTIPILEVKNKAGQTVFVVYPDSVHFFIKDDNSKGVLKGGFAVSGRSGTSVSKNDYLVVRPDSTRIYFKESGTKGVLKGGFAVSGRSGTKSGEENEYFNISASDRLMIVNPSEPRVMWYPKKEAFLTGRVLIESPDSVGLNSFATGFESKAIGNYSQAMGYGVIARKINSTAIGYQSIAGGVSSYAFGVRVNASDTNAFAFGHESAALAKGAFVFGEGDTAAALSSMALGYNNTATGVASLALGAYSLASDTLSVAMGYNTISEGVSSVAMGDNTRASGGSSLALGSDTRATGESSTAMGFGTVASGGGAIAMGHLCMASGVHSIAMGDSTIASSDDATAMGYQTTASGHFSTTMGWLTQASGNSAFALGSQTIASGEASLSMGDNTRAKGYVSMAMGNQTTAKGSASISVGINTLAEGDGSAAFGIGTHTTAMGSFVFGSYNESWTGVNSTNSTDDLFVIANGMDPLHPHNAFTVLKNGNVGINTNTADKLLTINGDARIVGDIYYGTTNDSIYAKPDFVFKPNYQKDFSIDYIERYINRHGHLPWLTAAKDEKDGINMTRMSFQTLEAVENQQLQIIQLRKKDLSLQKEILQLKQENQKLVKRIESLEKKSKK